MPCGVCTKVRGWMPAAIRQRLAEVEKRIADMKAEDRQRDEKIERERQHFRARGEIRPPLKGDTVDG
jgi:hypothetical protein